MTTLKKYSSKINVKNNPTSKNINGLEHLNELPFCIAINQNEKSLKNIEFAYNLAKKLSTNLKAISVFEGDLSVDHIQNKQNIESFCDDLRVQIGKHLQGYPGLTLNLKSGNASHTIINESNKFGMLFYSFGQVGGLGDILFNKDSNKILWNASCPVCILPSNEVNVHLNECTSFSIGLNSSHLQNVIKNFSNILSLKYQHVNVINKSLCSSINNESLMINEIMTEKKLKSKCLESSFSLCSIVANNTGEAIKNYLRHHNSECIIAFLSRKEIKDPVTRLRFQEMLSDVKVPVILIKE